jgi:CheY-like chemotaxis protein
MDATRPYILVVDDLVDAADSLATLLGIWGYDAKPHYRGVAALEAARIRRPDTVLLDLGMPGMSGFQFTLRLRDLTRCRTTPVVAVTGHAGLTLRAREVGIDHYLLKPISDLSRLKELLGQLTTSQRSARDGRGLNRRPGPPPGSFPLWGKHR